jgi:hypothetical protein
MAAEQLLHRIGPVFHWSDAHAAGLSDPVLYRLVEEGRIERVSHGLYRLAEVEITDLDLVVIAAASDRGTPVPGVGVGTSRPDPDQIPSRIDVALPRDSREPKVSASARWHQFARSTFDLGRDEIELDGLFTMGLYSPERSIVDAYRLRHLEGDELGREALEAYLCGARSQPSRLLAVSAPRVPEGRRALA